MTTEEAHGGCDCTELCAMGPTCPGGMLAGLPGSGCARTFPTESPQYVHGIDRRTQEHLCGVRVGRGTDAQRPGLKITCPVCIGRLGAYR